MKACLGWSPGAERLIPLSGSRKTMSWPWADSRALWNHVSRGARTGSSKKVVPGGSMPLLRSAATLLFPERTSSARAS